MKISEVLDELKDALQRNGDCVIYCNQDVEDDYGFCYTTSHTVKIKYGRGKIHILQGEYVKSVR